MRLLVTGGAGYVGSVTVEALVDAGHDVLVVDDLRTGHRAAVHPAARFVHADVADEHALRSALQAQPCDALLHFAAASLVGDSMRDPHRYFRDNVAATLALLRAVAAQGVERVVFSSTAALYGTPERTPIPETAALAPESVYGETKLQIERALLWLARTTGMASVALRYFNAAGASRERGEDHRPESHLIPLVLDVAMGERDAIDVFGDDYPTPDGTAVRDYVHVLDLADAHVRALAALEAGLAKAYNLGNGAGASVAQVVDTVRAVTGRDVPTRVAPRRVGDPPVLVADASLARRELGWSPQRPELADIVADAWRWRLANPTGYAA
ncbi:MAG: UDP-glucose 4-epimerase GalE [Trueperaceae bacterium]|nr:MAG: UDP-glucose 4-epimerase GalE [Trueperaceae bacterium]